MNVKDLSKLIQDELINAAQSAGQKYAQFDTEGALDEMTSYISRKGKYLRPLVFLLTYLMYGGKDVFSIIPAAIALELFHLFALAHDDIIDGDNMRGEAPSLGTNPPYPMLDNYPRRILLGDILHSLAYENLLKTQCPPEILHEAMKEMTRVSVITGLGVLSETTAGGRFRTDTTEKLYNLYERKTGYYSFAGPLKMGCLFAGKDEIEELNLLESAGLYLGRAYQLLDDARDSGTQSCDTLYSDISGQLSTSFDILHSLSSSSTGTAVLKDFILGLFPADSYPP